ncbi:MAG: metallophosphoesterase [Chitinophagales bacterium]|nr:metallophosphoesterase [Hyphomicrobiales bacterium]
MFTRRGLFKALGLSVAGGLSVGGYAFGAEPMLRLRVQRYQITPTGWPAGLQLRIAAIADIHAGEPTMSAWHIRRIVETTNALNADLIVLLGDYVAGHKFVSRQLSSPEWAGILGGLRAPLGVHAILGNHDWWDDYSAQARGAGPTIAGEALKDAGIALYENKSARLQKDGQGFWLTGLGDQLALIPKAGRNKCNRLCGVDDLPGALAQVTDDAPVILLAHEPDIFPNVPKRVALTLSGHTHGGQVRLFGYSPMAPSRYRNRYAYGHVVEDDRHLVVSGGLGCSIIPVRFGVPPEIVHITLGARHDGLA